LEQQQKKGKTDNLNIRTPPVIQTWENRLAKNQSLTQKQSIQSKT